MEMRRTKWVRNRKHGQPSAVGDVERGQAARPCRSEFASGLSDNGMLSRIWKIKGGHDIFVPRQSDVFR